MHKRLSLVFLPLLYAPISLANESAWNCEQSKETKEWTCVGDQKPASQTSDTNNAAAPEPSFIPKSIMTSPSTVQDDTATTPATPRAVIDTTEPTPKVKKVVPAKSTKPETPPVTTQASKPVSPDSVPVKPEVSSPVVVEDKEPVVSEPVPSMATTPMKPEDYAVVPRKVADAPAIIRDTPAINIAAEEDEDDDDKVDTAVEEKAVQDSKTKLSADTSPRTQGWNCDGKNQESNWDCHLVGMDPKGQARPVQVVNRSVLRLLDPAFDEEQEQDFGTLVSRMKADPWENCAVPQTQQSKVQAQAKIDNKKLRESAPTEIISNFAEGFDSEISSYLGNVEFKRADQHSLSHLANYDKISETLDLNGDVYYNEDDLALHGRSASIKLGSNQSKLRDTLFISPAGHIRGSSKVVYRDSKTLSRYKKVAYTTCPIGNQDWVLHASELKLNDEEKKGAAKNAWIEFKGVPVFYTPYISFPTDNSRKTGFLMPSFHLTKYAGAAVYAPFYWNIAPNYDALFTPRYLQKRGLLLDAKFRYLTDMTKGAVKVEYMPNDSQLHKARYLGEITNSTTYNDYIPGLSSSLDLNYVSDKNYFAQLGNALALPNSSYLRSFANMNYFREGVALTASVDNYQRIDPTLIGLPYRRLPQINLNLSHKFDTAIPINVSIDNESVFFQNKSLVNAERLNTKPTVTMPWQTTSAYITPKFALQYTHYSFSNTGGNVLTTAFLTPGTGVSSTVSNGIANSLSRTLPIVSLDSGMFFEKELHIGDSSMLHTLEPRLFYLYIPQKDQSNIPIFDSAAYDFVFASLFRENAFSGTDRIQSANQVSTALTSRLIDSKTGRERIKLNIGSIFYLQNKSIDPNLILPFAAINHRWVSPLVTELNTQVSDHVSLDTGMQWDPQVNTFSRGKAMIHYADQGKVFNAGYAYRRDTEVANRLSDIKQSDVSVHWPIYDDWSLVGRWQYSWLYNKTQEGFFGVEKENCCWRFQIIARHYMNSYVNTSGIFNASANSTIAQGTAQTTVFLQVELKGLGAIGDKLDSFFQQNIYGYRSPKQ